MATFSERYDTTIRALEQKLDAMIDDGQEFDLSRSGDVLTIEFEDGEKIIITPQSPLEQIWVSANYAGHRFNWSDGEWVNEKGGQTFNSFLADSISHGLGSAVHL